MANDSDADGDTLTSLWLAPAPTAAPSQSAATGFLHPGGWLHQRGHVYLCPQRRVHGGSATGTVTVAIKVDTDPAQNLNVHQPRQWQLQNSGQRDSGPDYRLQYTSSMSPADWQDLSSASVTATRRVCSPTSTLESAHSATIDLSARKATPWSCSTQQEAFAPGRHGPALREVW